MRKCHKMGMSLCLDCPKYNTNGDNQHVLLQGFAYTNNGTLRHSHKVPCDAKKKLITLSLDILKIPSY